MRRALDADFQKISLEEVDAGDVLLLIGHAFMLFVSVEIEHTALVTVRDPLTIIHASPPPVSRVVEQPIDDEVLPGSGQSWRVALTAAYRFRDVMEPSTDIEM